MVSAAAAIIAVRAPISYQSLYSDYASSKAQADAQQEFREKCWSTATIEETRACLESQIGASQETRRAEEDLYAQKQMAVWAMLIFWATVGIGASTIIVTAIGIYYVRETFRSQRIATEAATEANRVSRETMIADQRAWLQIVQTKFSASESDDGKRLSLRFDVLVKNIGKSPAHINDVTIKSEFDLFTFLPNIDESKLFPTRNVDKFRSIIFPNEAVMKSQSLLFSSENIANKIAIFKKRDKDRVDFFYCINIHIYIFYRSTLDDRMRALRDGHVSTCAPAPGIFFRHEVDRAGYVMVFRPFFRSLDTLRPSDRLIEPAPWRF